MFKMILPLGLGAAVMFSASASAQELGFSIGAEYSSGGSSDELELQSDADIWLAPLSIRFYGDNGSIGLSTAYADISGTPGTFLSIGPRQIELVPGTEGVSGFTDIVLSAERSFFFEDPAWPALNLSTSVKLPTASEEDGLGSGGTDVTVTAEMFKQVGKVIPYAYVGARFRGESDTVDTRNGLQAGLGLQVPVNDRLSLSVGYDFRQASVDDGEAAHELTALAGWRLTPATSVSTYVYGGFTEASPEIGAGVSISRRFSGF